MENASKALIIAGSILIGLLILSVLVYLFVSFGSSSKQIHAEIDMNRLNEFNNQFLTYEMKDDNTIYDIISVTNLAIENNKYYGYNETNKGNFYITVNAKIYKSSLKKDLQLYDIDAIQNLAKNEQNNMYLEDTETPSYERLPRYSCKVTINEDTGRVSCVDFNAIDT